MEKALKRLTISPTDATRRPKPRENESAQAQMDKVTTVQEPFPGVFWWRDDVWRRLISG